MEEEERKGVRMRFELRVKQDIDYKGFVNLG